MMLTQFPQFVESDTMCLLQVCFYEGALGDNDVSKLYNEGRQQHQDPGPA